MTPKQTNAIEAAKTLRSSRHVMSSFEATEIGDTVMISRQYGPEALPRLYHEIYFIGPRGGIKRRKVHITA